MKCPICDIDMRITEREGVEIDYCPQCRGVWLDRGELEKLISRVEAPGSNSRGRHDRDEEHHDHGERTAPPYNDDRQDEDAHRGTGERPYKGKRKEGFLSQLFDVFGD